jgi:uncharacterized protein (DUF58 family)
VSTAKKPNRSWSKDQEQSTRVSFGTSGTGSTGTQPAVAAQALTELSGWGLQAVAVARKALQWAGETVTPIGWQSFLLVAIGLPIGFIWSWPEFLILGIASGIVSLIAVPFLFGGKSYAVSFQLPDDRIVAGDEIEARVEVQNTSNHIELPGQLDVPIGKTVAEIPIPLMRPSQVVDIAVPIPAQRRGVLDVGPISSIRTDLVGVLRREIRWAEVRKLFVHPRTVSIRSTTSGIIRDLEGLPTTNIVDSDISFHAIRDYQPGDGQRHIHWKSTAKTGKLMVRQFEESRRSRIALMLASRVDEYSVSDEDEFELAVSTLASIGVRAILDSRDISVLSGVAETVISEQAVRRIRTLNTLSARKLLDDLCFVGQYERGLKIDEVCRFGARDLTDMSLAVIVVGSTMSLKDMSRARLQLPSEIGVLFIQINARAQPGFATYSNLDVLTVAVLEDLAGLLARFQ